MKIVLRYIFIFNLLLLIVCIACRQTEKDPFKGIRDETILAMLKHLPFTYGGMNISASDGRLLYDLIIKKGYQRGLEIGTSNGYSTLWLGLAFKETGGEVITIEIEPLRAKEAQANFRDAGLDDVIDSRINDAFDEIPKIEGNFDFVFLDAWKQDYIKFFNLLKGRIKPGGVFTAHNVINMSSSMQDFLKEIKFDSTFETAIYRTSRSGISVSAKKAKESIDR